MCLTRRYAIAPDPSPAKESTTGVLVIGAGVAGLRAALAAARHGSVRLVCKGSISNSNTWYAQGGIAIPQLAGDDRACHVEDTLRVGCGLADRHVVECVIGRAPQALEQLLAWGMAFDRGADGLARAREGGHSRPRVLHAGGDATGLALSQTLNRQVCASDAIEIVEDMFVFDLLTVAGRCVGAAALTARGETALLPARRTIIAAGGAGELFARTTNPPGATADGMAMAFRAGATLRDLEFMQFHPTALNSGGTHLPLISEAVRGEGGRLVDRRGRPFMHEYHPSADLAPRDIVSRAIYNQMTRSGDASVFLDVRHFPPGQFARRFPGLFMRCQTNGINPEREPIPVRPAAHYAIGGIKTDLNGRSTLPGLFACGEAAASGMHGANRLASNSLLEALVLGEFAGESAGHEAAADADASFSVATLDMPVPTAGRACLNVKSLRDQLREQMWRHNGVVRDRGGLETLRKDLTAMRRELDASQLQGRDIAELINLCTIATLMTAAALTREESRGVHYRRDLPAPDDAGWRRRIEFTWSGQDEVIPRIAG